MLGLGEQFAKTLFVSNHFEGRVQEERVLEAKRRYESERHLTIESAVSHFKNKEAFIKAMAPLDDYSHDAVARDFIQGVVDRFAEIEEEKSHGFDWVYRELKQ